MIATIQAPDRIGQEHLDKITSVIRDFHAERARFEGFACELSTEWQQLSDELQDFSTSLSYDEESLRQRERRLEQSQQTIEGERQQAQEAARQLTKLQTDLAICQEQRDQMRCERDAVRQHAEEVSNGFAAISELMRIVQSTHDEMDQVQAAIQSHAAELSAVIGCKGGTTALGSSHTRPASVPCEVSPAKALPLAEEPPTSPAYVETEQTSNDRVEPAHQINNDNAPTDPVIGSVLAELNRLGKG